MNFANVFKKENKQIELMLDILTREQVENLEIFGKFGRSAIMTDLACLRGGCSDWWTKTSCENIKIDDEVYVVTYNGIIAWKKINSKTCGIRPYLPYSLIKPFITNRIINSQGVVEIEFGEYQQWVVAKNLFIKLETEFCNGNFINKNPKHDLYLYTYKGKKYIRTEANPHKTTVQLSNGEKYNKGQYVWIEVSPIKWLVDEKSDIAITKYIISSGVPFSLDEYYSDYLYKGTTIKYFLDNYLSKDIFVPELYKASVQKNLNAKDTLLGIIEQAQEEMDEILKDVPFQKIKK